MFAKAYLDQHVLQRVRNVERDNSDSVCTDLLRTSSPMRAVRTGSNPALRTQYSGSSMSVLCMSRRDIPAADAGPCEFPRKVQTSMLPGYYIVMITHYSGIGVHVFDKVIVHVRTRHTYTHTPLQLWVSISFISLSNSVVVRYEVSPSSRNNAGRPVSNP